MKSWDVRLLSRWAVKLLVCLAIYSALMLPRWDVCPVLPHWDVPPLGCCPVGLLSHWDVPPLGCCPVGLLSHWDVPPLGCSPSLVLASTDPISATVSATATVPQSIATTSDDQAPTPPILVAPQDDSVTADPKPEFAWRRSTDPNGNTVIYTLYLNGVATYLGISDTQNSATSSYISRVDQDQIKLVPLNPLPDGHYTWYVQASDVSGNNSSSTIWDLTIDTRAPIITIITLDTLDNPDISEGSNFDITGPKDIYFTISSDPQVILYMTITSLSEDSSGLVYHLTATTGLNGLAYIYQHLTPGLYQVTLLGYDQAQNRGYHPSFTLRITQAQVTVPLPAIPGLPGSITIPYYVHAIPTLPATIARIESRLSLPYLASILLAVLLSILLIFIWRRRYNLILLNPQFLPLKYATVYHSLPNQTSTLHELKPADHGRLYIKGLAKYSTITIRLQSENLCTTHILSISAKQRLYTIIIG